MSVNPLYKDLPTADAKASTANLDKWLYELQKRVDKLEADNLAKDKTISDLKDQLAKSTTTAAPPNWGNLFKKNTQEEVIFLAKVAKESNDKIKKENNILISGLPESTSQDKDEK